MQTNETKKAGASSFLGRMVRKQVMIPLAALLLLFLFNLIVDPSFFKIELGYNSAGNPVLSGFLITILDSGSDIKYEILDGKVQVNGETEERRGRKLHKGDVFRYAGRDYKIV